jgi:uncharacterized membrane protein YvbJ
MIIAITTITIITITTHITIITTTMHITITTHTIITIHIINTIIITIFFVLLKLQKNPKKQIQNARKQKRTQ